MKQTRSFVLCLAILGVGLPAAADTKSIHGAACQEAQLFTGSSVHYGAVSGIYVQGAGAYVVCPLIRDRINSTTSMSSVVAEVYIPSGGFILCSLYSQTEDSGSGNYVDVDSQERYTAGNGQMSFSVDSSNGNEGSYGLFCDMSGDTEIRHIHTDENNGATD
jgi:hypothetical protein